MSVLNPGVREVTVKGNNVVGGAAVSAVSFVEDPSGYFALRVVDAAPFAYDEITERLKVQVEATGLTQTHTAVNAATTSTVVLAANAARRYALIINNSDAEVFLALGATAVASTGILLLSKGSSYEITPANLFVGAINAIHAGTGTKALLVTEGI